MFIDNKYKKWYDAIITKAQSRTQVLLYSEIHHIIPCSLGGNNTSENLVTLSAREHFICHLLLSKFTIGDDKRKMCFAARMMAQVTREFQNRYTPSSKIYELIKSEISRIGHSKDTRQKMSESAKGKKKTPQAIAKQLASKSKNGTLPGSFGVRAKRKATMEAKGTLPSSDHVKAKRKATMEANGSSRKGKKLSLETIEKIRQSNTGKSRSPEQRLTLSIAQKNRKSYNFTEDEKRVISAKISAALRDKPKSEDHKSKLSESLKGKSPGPRSEETKQKMRKPKSEAHCRAISEGRKAKFQKIREQIHTDLLDKI